MTEQRGSKLYWRIRGYDSLTLKFEHRVPVGQMTERKVRELLRALVARDLSLAELFGSFAKRGSKIHLRFLDVHKENLVEQRRTHYSCGDNPYYIADVERGE